MEIIGTGILLAIGFYLAPIIFSVCVMVVAGVFSAIGSLFGGGR